MQLIAESQVPSVSSYVHLGYLSATTTQPHDGLFTGGLILAVAGFLAMVRLIRTDGKTETGQPRVALRASWVGLIGGLCLMLGAVLVHEGYRHGKEVYAHPQSMTWYRMRDVSRLLVKPEDPYPEWYERNPVKRVPRTEGEHLLAAAVEAEPGDEDLFLDGWMTPMHLRVTKREDRFEYVLVSAGPDRRMGTSDDMKFSEQDR